MGDAMDQQDPFKFVAHLPTSYPSDLASLQTLIQGCHNGDRMAFEELMSRYTRHFIRTIRKTFAQANRKDLAGNRGILYEVYLQIVDKILERGLKSNVTAAGLSAYSKEMAHNETITWLRKQGVKKNVIIHLEERHTTALDMPLGAEANQTLGDMIAGHDAREQEENSRIGEEVARLLDEIADMDPQKRLVFRVYLMFYDSLSNAEIKEIARSRKASVKEISVEVERLLGDLVKRESQRVRCQDLAGIAWYMVQKLERRLLWLKENPDSDNETIGRLQEELEHQRKRHEKLIKKAGSLVRPTNKEICRLLGLDASDAKIVKGISLKVFRMREELNAHSGLKRADK
jgi:hypothetical protein